jgi:hypothetical protein
MAETLKILGQMSPAATTNTVLCVVPASLSFLGSSITVCNTNGVSSVFRIYIVKSGGFASVSNALYYDVVIPANETFIATVGLTMSTGDFIIVYATNSGLSFQLFGSEVS